LNPELSPIIEEMLFEFMGSKPEICLIPSKDENCAKDGGMIRVATIVNPKWYQEMCADFPPVNWKNYNPHRKKQRTIVKRKDIVALMERILKNGESSSKYASYIIGEAERRLEIYSDTEKLEPWKGQF